MSLAFIHLFYDTFFVVVVIFVLIRLGNSFSFATIFISVSVGVLLLFRLTSAAIRKSQFLFSLLSTVDGVVVVFDFQFFIFQQRGRESGQKREYKCVRNGWRGREKERHVK